MIVHAIVMSLARLVLLMMLLGDQFVFFARRVEIVLFRVIDLVYHKLGQGRVRIDAVHDMLWLARSLGSQVRGRIDLLRFKI